MIKRLKKHSHLMHKTGMFLSLLCLVHCLAMPFLITAIPFLAKNYINHDLEIIIILASVSLGILLLIRDYKAHRNFFPLVLLSFAVSLQMLGLFILHEKHETLLVVLGSLILALAYIFNWHFHRKVCNNHAH